MLWFNKKQDVVKAPKQDDAVVATSIVNSLFDFETYNPDELLQIYGSTIYSKMMKDEQVKAGIRFRRNSITAREWSLSYPEDSDLSDEEKGLRIKVITSGLKKMPGSFKKALDKIMASMYQGFSITEKSYKAITVDGVPYWGIKSLTKKEFSTFKFKVDDYGALVEVYQDINGAKNTVDMESVIHHVHNAEENEYFGQSELRESYRSWWAKDTIIKLENIFIERMAGGFVWAAPELNSDITITPGTPIHTAIQNVLSTIMTKTGILMPKGLGLHVEFPKDTEAFDRAIGRHNRAIALSLLMPHMLGMTEQKEVGGSAQAETQQEGFLWMLDSEASDLEETIDEQLIVEMCRYNFGDDNAPIFKLSPLSKQQQYAVLKIWGELVTKGAVEASDTDEEFIRTLLEMPEKGEPLKKPSVDIGQEIDSVTGLPIEKTKDEILPDKKPDEQFIKKVKFSNAERRVDFVAIERSSNALQWQYTDKLAGHMEDMADHFIAIINADNELLTNADKVGLLKVPPSINKAIKADVGKMLSTSWDIGVDNAKRELTKSGLRSFTKIEFAKFTSLGDNAANWFAGKKFSITGKLTQDNLNIMQNVLFNSIKFGKSKEDTVKDIVNALSKAGLISSEYFEQMMGEALGVANPSHRLDTIVRTNTFEAINEARYDYFSDPSLGGFVRAGAYSSILDSRTTPTCRELGGEDRADNKPYVAPIGSSEWDSLRPPNHFNCRALLVPVTTQDDDVINIWEVINKPAEGFS